MIIARDNLSRHEGLRLFRDESIIRGTQSLTGGNLGGENEEKMRVKEEVEESDPKLTYQ
jgi:hypothetical protein